MVGKRDCSLKIRLLIGRLPTLVGYIFVLALATSGQQSESTNIYPSLKPVLTLLNDANLSGSLELSGTCEQRGKYPELPSLSVPKNSGSPLQQLRETFGRNSNIRVHQEPSGRVRIVEGGVPEDFLRVKLKHISFDNTGAGPKYAFSPNVALRSILRTQEVQTFLRLKNIEWPFAGDGIGGAAEPVDLLHVSGALDDVTVTEALDYILRTFGGIWLYQNCPATENRRRIVYIRFYRIAKVGSSISILE